MESGEGAGGRQEYEMRNKYPGLAGMLREMFKDEPEEYRSPQEIDAETDAEKAEQLMDEDPDEVVDIIPVGSEREKAELLEAEETLRDLRFGIVLLSALCLFLTFFVKPHWRYAVGVVIGCVLALFLVQKIYESVSVCVMLDEKGAVRYARKHVAIRYFATFAVLALTMFLGGIAMGAGTILASFTLKPSAYFQPWLRRLKRRLFKKEVKDNG